MTERYLLDNSAAYIRSWLKVLKDDRRAVIVAAGQAQKAADFILNRTAPPEGGDEEPRP